MVMFTEHSGSWDSIPNGSNLYIKPARSTCFRQKDRVAAPPAHLRLEEVVETELLDGSCSDKPTPDL